MKNQKALMAETAVVGSILISNDCLDEVLGELREDDFETNFLRRVFIGIVTMRRRDPNQIIDILTVSDFLKPIHGESDKDVFREVVEIANSTFSCGNIKAYVEMVKKESNRRRTATLMNLTSQKLSRGDDDYLEFVRNGLTHIENDSPFVVRTFAQNIDDVITKLHEDCHSGLNMTGLSTGFSDLDHYTNGLQNGDLVILAARPSMGKTMLMLNIAENISFLQQSEPVVLFSLEMPAAQISKRTVSRVSRVKGDLIFKAKLGSEHWAQIAEAITKMNTSKLFINDSSRMSVYQMRSYCRKVRNEHGLKAIFIDYIGLMDGEGENETLRLGNISRDLKAMAKDFNVPVFVLCQLNRKIEERKDRTPMLSDIRQSGNIEQDADLVMFLDRDKEVGKQATLHIAKHRNGAIGEFKLSLNLDNFEFRNYYGV